VIAYPERDSRSAARCAAAATGPHLLRPPAPCPLRRRPPRLGRGSKSLAISISFTSFRLHALKLSCSFFSYPRPLFSIVCGLFCEKTGGDIPLPDFHQSQVTSHQSRPANSFRPLHLRAHLARRIRSYENPGGGAPSPPAIFTNRTRLRSVPSVRSPAPTRSRWQIFLRRVILFLGIAAREA
jgi:hypothetical protein